MNTKITERFDRARLYLDRIREDLRKRDPKQGMVHAAELGYQAGQLYALFRLVAQSNGPTDMPPENSEK